MKPGTVVKFKEPLNKEEETERFIVLEDREDRVLLSDLAFKAWPIPPVFCYRKNYMVEV